ncbi:MAG TPA: hypothetical protein VK163_01270 [Opitutaceae bacterium]|nr:hypothetical protein [Opitutaceae bacterium]
MTRERLISTVPGLAGFIGSVTLPEVSAAQWAAIAATFSGLMGGLWFAVQIALALERRSDARRRARQDNPAAE